MIPPFHLLRWPVPETLPDAMKPVAERLRTLPGQMPALHEAYDIVSTRFRMSRFLTYVRLDALLDTDLERIWNRTDYLQCTHVNHLIKVLMVHSAWFDEPDLRARWTTVWAISPHQYLRARLKDGTTLDVDPWGRVYGVPFGSHVHGWNGSFRAVWPTRG